MDGVVKKSAFILGYSGEIGKELVKEVSKSNFFAKVVLIGRRRIDYTDETLAKLEQRFINFEELEGHREAFKDIQVGFCCLGTTRGEAGADGYYKVDHDYVVNSAKIAQEGGCEEMHLISSFGAHKDSFFLYNKTKGQVEQELTDLMFKKLFIYRPSVLLCDREKSRPAERFLKAITKPITYTFPTFMSIPTTTVAKAMVATATNSGSYAEALVVLDNKKIHQIGV